MASFSYSFALFMAAGLLFGLSSPVDAQTCSSQTFDNRNYTNCVDLPYLKAYLHWTYDESNSSLSIAFIAPPDESDGWVAWAINPTATGMVGSQAFIAFPLNGTVVVGTYNISSYASFVQSMLSFDVWDLGVGHSNGNYTIFATVKVPAMAKSVNQVWQTGPTVDQTTGQISRHSFSTDHISSKGVLSLTTTESPASASSSPSSSPPPPPPPPSTGFSTSPPPPSTGSSTSPPPPSTGSSTSPPPPNGGRRIRATTVGFTGVCLFLAALLVVF